MSSWPDISGESTQRNRDGHGPCRATNRTAHLVSLPSLLKEAARTPTKEAAQSWGELCREGLCRPRSGGRTSRSVYGATQAVSVEVGQHCYTARPQAIVRSSAQHVALCSTLWSFGRSRRGPPRKRGHGFLRDLRPESALGGTPVGG